MSRPKPGTAPLLVSGALVAASVVPGLPLPLALPVAGTLLVLLGLVIRRIPAALTGMATLVVVTTAARYQLHPNAGAALTTTALLVLLLVTSLPFTIGRRLPTLPTLGLTAAAAGLMMLLLVLAGSVHATGPVAYVVGLAATATAYGLAIPARRRSTRMQDHDVTGGG